MLPRLEHWKKALRTQMDSSVVAQFRISGKGYVVPQLQPQTNPDPSSELRSVMGLYTKESFGSGRSCVNQSRET